MQFINYYLLPIVVSEAIHRIVHNPLQEVWDHLFYYGWNVLLCLLCGHFLTQFVSSVVLKEILIDSISYTVLVGVCYSIVCFLVNHAIQNFSLEVNYNDKGKKQ